MPTKKKSHPAIEACPPVTEEPSPPVSFGQDLAEGIRELSEKGLTASSALELLSLLIPAVLSSSREDIDRLKMLDKMLNTARAMVETKLKTEESRMIAVRLDELESRMDGLSTSG